MTRKRNESQFKNMCKKYEWMSVKYRDRQFVPCMNCGKMTLIPKSDKKPDYLLAYEWAYVEAKGAKDTFNFQSDITAVQRETMVQVQESWLFLEIGTGRAPNGKGAFLVPWKKWIAVESEALFQGHKSIRWLPDNEEKGNRIRVPLTREVIEDYRLVWEDSCWTIPEDHVFWKYRNGTKETLDDKRNKSCTAKEDEPGRTETDLSF